MRRELRRRARIAMASVLTGVIGVTVACGGGGPIADEAPALRVAYAGVADFGDLAAEMANDDLRAQGYRVETVSFATAEIAADALARGEVDLGLGSTRSFWAATAKGAPVRTILEHSVNVHRLVGVERASPCEALDGKRLALQSEGAAGTALVRAFLAERCPGATPDVIMVPGSGNRFAALLAGSIDATVLQQSDVSRLTEQAPGRFVVIADFLQVWPELRVTGVQVNSRFAAAHPAWIDAYVQARLSANHRATTALEDVVQYANTLLGPQPRWSEQAREYAALPVWPRDGGLTRAGAAATLAFLQARSGLAPGLTVDDVVDFSFLDRALASTRRATGDSTR